MKRLAKVSRSSVKGLVVREIKQRFIIFFEGPNIIRSKNRQECQFGIREELDLEPVSRWSNKSLVLAGRSKP